MTRRTGRPCGLPVFVLLLNVPAALAGSGDHNGDGRVDAGDLAGLPGCLTGPGGGPGGGCDPFDFDIDLDVDAHDVAGLQLAFGSTLGLTIETVPVGNAGNPGEQSRIPNGDQNFYGQVAYAFEIGKYEITAGQYTAFLNAVAATDTHHLYHPRMDYEADPTRNGCNIRRQGVAGSYTYSVAPDWAKRPVNYVGFGDALRFANWLHNGQPTGAQDLTTTEDGSYFLNGMVSDSQLEHVVREPDATWVIPTENEWYKAAYHKNDGVTGNYWNYPTSADNGVSHDLVDPDPGNNATCSGGVVGDWTIGAPYYRTEAGDHEHSASAYGAFDLGGNVQEWNETVPESDIRGIRGGSWFWGVSELAVWARETVYHSSDHFDDVGFRVARLP